MNPMTRITPRVDVTMLIAGLAGLLVGVALTFILVLGTHWFERVRTVQVTGDTSSAVLQSVPVPAADPAQASSVVQDPGDLGVPVGGIRSFDEADDPNSRVDPVGQSPASIAAEQRRVDQENMIRHDPPLPAIADAQTGDVGTRVGPGERDGRAPGGLDSIVTTSSIRPHQLSGPGERDFLAPGGLGGAPQHP